MTDHRQSYLTREQVDALESKLQSLRKEIEHLEPRAEAERLLTIADPARPNPWAGATQRLAELQQAVQEAQDEAAAQQLLRALEQYEGHVRATRDPELKSKMDSLYAEMQKSDKKLIARWDGFYDKQPGWQTWMNRLINDIIKNPSAPIPGNATGLSDDELRHIAHHFASEREMCRHGNVLHSHSASIRMLEDQVPHLRGIEVAESAVAN